MFCLTRKGSGGSSHARYSVTMAHVDGSVCQVRMMGNGCCARIARAICPAAKKMMWVRERKSKEKRKSISFSATTPNNSLLPDTDEFRLDSLTNRVKMGAQLFSWERKSSRDYCGELLTTIICCMRIKERSLCMCLRHTRALVNYKLFAFHMLFKVRVFVGHSQRALVVSCVLTVAIELSSKILVSAFFRLSSSRLQSLTFPFEFRCKLSSDSEFLCEIELENIRFDLTARLLIFIDDISPFRRT